MMRRIFVSMLQVLVVASVVGLFGVGVMQAQVPSGTPSRLRVLSLGVDTAAPSTNGFIKINGTGPTIQINESDAALNAKAWRIAVGGSQLSMGICADNFSTCSNAFPFLTVDRTGDTTNSLITFQASAIDANSQLALIRPGEAHLTMRDTNAPADEKNWRWRSVGGQFVLSAYNDAFSTNSNPIALNRTGIVTDTLDLTATTLTMTGANVNVSASALTIPTTGPQLRFTETDGTLDNKSWNFAAAGEQLAFALYNDALSGGTNWLTVSRSGTTATSIDFTSNALTWNGAPLRSQGTFILTMQNACTVDQNITVDWSRAGSIVVMALQAPVGCTADSTSYSTTGTPVPATIRPTHALVSPVFTNVTNNGANASACVQVLASGQMQLGLVAANDCNVLGWTAAGTRGFNGVLQITYMIGDP